MPTRKLISFDWAMKKLLRSKANFEILEGFLSELLKEDVRIQKVLESESTLFFLNFQLPKSPLQLLRHPLFFTGRILFIFLIKAFFVILEQPEGIRRIKL